MKTLFALIIILALTNCIRTKVPSPLNMKGTYSTLITQPGGGSGDTLIQKEQFKIYTNHHMIYVYPQITDSLAIYGIGTYQIKEGKVIENIFYTSLDGPKKDTFTLNIDKSDKGYQQVIEFVSTYNKKYLLTEDYTSIGRSATSPLDGAWKQIRNLHIKENGDIIVNKNITQFKVYQSGNFIWVNTYSNHTARSSNSKFGYGQFEMNGTSGYKELNINSTYSSLVNTPVNIELKFLSKDVYQQTIRTENNGKQVEVYKRLG